MDSARLRRAFGDTLREARESRGLTQEALSFECGRHRTYVSLIERGKNAPSIVTLWLLADALAVEPAELVERTQQRLQK
jgi:transcriptional regulator with XRE-family HTH domain